MRLKETACRMCLSCGIWRRNKTVLSGWNSSVHRVGRFFTARERSVTETSNTSCRSLQSLLLTNSFMINDEETEKPSEDLNIFTQLSCLPLLKTRLPHLEQVTPLFCFFFFLIRHCSLHASIVHIFHSFFSPSFLPPSVTSFFFNPFHSNWRHLYPASSPPTGCMKEDAGYTSALQNWK